MTRQCNTWRTAVKRKKQVSARQKELELLAPAKDIQCAEAAISCGADAVYIGAPRFGARAAVGNSILDIEKAARYAHRYRAKVYVTLNTLLHDHELEEARAIVRDVYEAGADALIIQDMGLLEMDLPPIQLFASTQTHNYSPEKILFLEKAGFRRIILARELSLEQIRQIRRLTAVELETFVHGALCVSFSGQCYLSCHSTRRSANRGECSQPCRMKYTLTDEKKNVIIKDKYLLSLKDLNLTDHLSGLVSSGITSFKIEGRLKDITYVKNITAWYRRKLDEIIPAADGIKRASEGETVTAFTPDPERTFNRGYTGYFIEGRSGKMASFNTPKSTGKYIGKVSEIYGDHFLLESSEMLKNGDGICYFDKNGSLTGMNVTRAEGRKVFVCDTKGLRPGTELYRNRENELSKDMDDSGIRRQVKAELVLEETEDGLRLRAKDACGATAYAEIQTDRQAADKPERMRDTWLKQLGKSGDSIFSIEKTELNTSAIYFMPVSAINELRRRALMALEEVRTAAYRREEFRIEKNDFPFPSEDLDFRGNVLNEKARRFYIRHGVKGIQPGFEASFASDDSSDIAGPLMTCRYCIKKEIDACPKDRPNTKYGRLFLSGGGHKYELHFDCVSCQMMISGLVY